MDLVVSTGVAAWGAMVVDHNDGIWAKSHCLTVSDVVVLHFVSSEKSKGVYEWLGERFVGSVGLFHRTRLVLCEWLEFGHGEAEVVLRGSIRLTLEQQRGESRRFKG